MKGTWAADNEKSVVFAHDNVDCIASSFQDCSKRILGDWKLCEEKLGRNERILSQDYIESVN